MKSIQHHDPVFKQLFAEISPEIADTFTSEQIEAIKRVFGRNWNRHPIDVRVSVPILELRFYLVLLAGSERRSKQRLRSEKGVYPLRTPGNIVFLLGFFTILLTCGFTTSSLVSSSLTSTSDSSFPTSIPWLHNQSECEHTGRSWRKGECWDSEHNPMF